MTSPSKELALLWKLSLKYKRNILWQRRYTQNGIWLEIDINLNSWECVVNHKIFIFWLKVEIYRFIRGSCLEKVSVFVFFFCFHHTSFTKSPTANKKMTFVLIFSEQGALVSLSHNIGKILVLTERHIYSFSDYFPVLLQSCPVLCNLAWGEISRIMLVQCGSSRFAEVSLAHTIAIACTVYSRCKASFMGLKNRWCFFEKRTQDGKINLSWCKVGVKQL